MNWGKTCAMKYLHTMVRTADLAASLHFYCDALGLHEVRRIENEKGRYTLVFVAAPGDDSAQVEWTPRSILVVATSVTSPTRSRISIRPVSGSCSTESRYPVRRAMAAWPSYARRIRSRSRFCSRAEPWRRGSPGCRCRMWARGSRSRSYKPVVITTRQRALPLIIRS